MNRPVYAVTGGLGYSGRRLCERLLRRQPAPVIRVLTNSTHRPNPFGDRVEVHRLAWEEPDRLTAALRGVDVLFNNYWVRFNHRDFTHEQAVRRSAILFDCARRAGVGHVVHVSITNPSADSPLSYFRGKARVEAALAESGRSHTILRPAVLFGYEDILINNLAWALRRFPCLPVFGDGSYRLQPIHVDDLAALAEEAARERPPATLNAIGPEDFRYADLVRTIGRIIGRPRPLVRVPPGLGWLAGRLIGWWQRDQFITRDEIIGLMANLLHVETAPTGTTRLTEWAARHADTLGRTYANELARRRPPTRQARAG